MVSRRIWDATLDVLNIQTFFYGDGRLPAELICSLHRSSVLQSQMMPV